MTWAKFDDRYPWHRKVRGLSDAAFRLDVSAVCWCAENLTDGVIEAEFLTLVSDVRNPRKAAAELVRSGRWHGHGHDCESCPTLPAGAHVVHDYLDYNPTREKVEEEREKRRKAGELGGRASGRSRAREANAKQSASQVLNDLPSKREAQVASSPTNPRTRTPSLTTSVKGGSHVSNASPPKRPLYCCGEGDPATCLPPCAREVARLLDREPTAADTGASGLATATEQCAARTASTVADHRPGRSAPLYSDRCTRHGDVLEPGNCGGCADVRKANEQRPRHLAAVADGTPCLIHLENDVDHCRGCAADRKAAG